MGGREGGREMAREGGAEKSLRRGRAALENRGELFLSRKPLFCEYV